MENFCSAPQEKIMTLNSLCDHINLQPEVKLAVLDFAANFDFREVEEQLREFCQYEKMKKARIQLQTLLEPDETHIKILACMLKASADAYQIYQEKGICDQIYFDTMKCYTRFLEESQRAMGTYYFDRQWWTTRQAGCHLFRIGELEYEMMPTGSEMAIALHIPSDADFAPEQVERSLNLAQSFFQQYYPTLTQAEYRCNSWLLDPQLKTMLNADSNILHFQTRFELIDRGEVNTEFIEWLFQTKSQDISTLPERTSLQRNVKRHLLAGGQIYTAFGRWIK